MGAATFDREGTVDYRSIMPDILSAKYNKFRRPVSKQIQLTANGDQTVDEALFTVPKGSIFLLTSLNVQTNHTSAGTLVFFDGNDGGYSDENLRAQFPILASLSSNSPVMWSTSPPFFQNCMRIKENGMANGKAYIFEIEGYIYDFC